MTTNEDDGAWFAPKRFGIGAGRPIRWQGWALIGLYAACLFGARAIARIGTSGARAAEVVLIVFATAMFIAIVARHTRGGLRWRWGRN
ncbi:hypothetical protein [Novosphingobium sp. Leaf2]|uniref:hypothetical protein n=1 Tax=Novosphingobium sp. Leaf2 TaxID=1735670 RepID=UPI0006F212FB|nr:hypothetical protein [Novosphingobium sp. Leaf2]KQM19520.1 hypothetical protein ASE49_04650 [Novosphingobium sp. Leaf2]